MSQHILSMQPLRAISMAICLLFTSLFLFSCEEEELYRNPFEGQWRTMLLDDYGRRIVSYYAFDSNGYGTYTLYREGFYAEPLESSRFRYDYDRFAIEIRYETGARDRFQYFFQSYDRFQFTYRNRMGQEMVETYVRVPFPY